MEKLKIYEQKGGTCYAHAAARALESVSANYKYEEVCLALIARFGGRWCQ